MTSPNLSFIAKVIALSGAIGALIKYVIPPLLPDAALATSPALAVVVALLLAPSVLMGSLFWLRRSADG
jgi:hypothetical protein